MRTKPNKDQANYLYRYYLRRLSMHGQTNLTDMQRENALDELKAINQFSPELPDTIYAWAKDHIPSDLYSASIRAANKKLKRYKPSGESRRKTTVSIDVEVSDKLERVFMLTDGLEDMRLTKGQAIECLVRFFKECELDPELSAEERKRFNSRIVSIVRDVTSDN